MKLLTWQKDKIYEIIVSSNLNPQHFKIELMKSKKSANEYATLVKYKNSDYYFIFDTILNYKYPYYVIYSPGDTVYFHESYATEWNNLIKYFSIWIIYLFREVNSPHYWERFEKEINELNLIGDEYSDEKFSVYEYEDLKIKIDILKNDISKIDIGKGSINVINKKLDEITELAKTMNKFDWKSLFIGTIVNLIIQLSIAPENTKSIWLLVKNIFKMYFLN
jgi:hypothetical protein